MAADPPGEAGHVADARARARLAARDLALEHDRVEPLRRRVDRRREAGRPGADDRDVVDVGAEPDAAADGLDDVAVGRVEQQPPVVPDDGRQARAGLPDLAQQRAALLGVGRVEGERRVEAREQVADRVGPRAVLGRRDPEQREPARAGSAPSSPGTRSRRDTARGRGTTASRGDSRSGRASSRARSGSPPCSPARRAGSASPAGCSACAPARNSMPGQLRHALVGDQQCDRLAAVGERGRAAASPSPGSAAATMRVSFPKRRPRSACSACRTDLSVDTRNRIGAAARCAGDRPSGTRAWRSEDGISGTHPDGLEVRGRHGDRAGPLEPAPLKRESCRSRAAVAHGAGHLDRLAASARSRCRSARRTRPPRRSGT